MPGVSRQHRTARGALSDFAHTAMQPDIRRASLRIALVVGTILNAINQGGRIIDGGSPQWGQFALNYAVPFCVSCFSAVRARQRRPPSPRHTDPGSTERS